MKRIIEKHGKKWVLCESCEQYILLEPAGVGSLGNMGFECKTCYNERMNKELLYYTAMMTPMEVENE